VAQGIGPELKPQYCKKEKKKTGLYATPQYSPYFAFMGSII
jgi:hypothetical protein